MLSDDDMYRMMQRGWRGGRFDGTECGKSSMRHYARKAVQWLPEVCARHGIESVNDAGAGDMHWVRDVQWDVIYQAFDLFPRAGGVNRLDITRDLMPDSDAILCRMVLNHLGEERTSLALDLFGKSSRYLIATHFVGENEDKNREFQRLDLTQWLGEPLEMTRDGHEDNCRLALWSLS